MIFNGMVTNQGVNASGGGVFDNGGRVRRRRVTPIVLALSHKSTEFRIDRPIWSRHIESVEACRVGSGRNEAARRHRKTKDCWRD